MRKPASVLLTALLCLAAALPTAPLAATPLAATSLTASPSLHPAQQAPVDPAPAPTADPAAGSPALAPSAPAAGDAATQGEPGEDPGDQLGVQPGDQPGDGAMADPTEPVELPVDEAVAAADAAAAAANTAAPAIVINEIHFDPKNKPAGDEFVELFNASPEAVNLAGWSLAKAVDYVFPSGTLLPPGGYLAVAQNPGALQRDYGAAAAGPFIGRLANDGDEVVLRDRDGDSVDVVNYKLGFPWPTPDDGRDQSIGLLSPGLDNAQPAAWRSGAPTPGHPNAAITGNPPPYVDAVQHTPFAPHSWDAITFRAHVTDADGVTAVRLWLQPVTPGFYLPITDPAFWKQWTPVAMQAVGNDNYEAQLPQDMRRHRWLIRYRIEAVDKSGQSILLPYADDPQPNFALYIYDGAPPWRGALKPNTGGLTGENRDYDFTKMRSLPIYQLIAQEVDVANSQFIPGATLRTGYTGNDYPWHGTLVVNGAVYDHIGFRARGGEYRYSVGKNHWKFKFTRGHGFQAYDDYGKPFGVKRKFLNFSGVFQHAQRGYRGEQGLFETLSYRIFNLAGVPASETNFVHFRVVDRSAEAGGSQYDTDFWGLYLAIENMDGRFLDEHGLSDGNFYDMQGGTGELDNVGDSGPLDKSDLNTFINAYANWTPDANWWRRYFDLAGYYKFRSALEMVHHYDVDQGKNYYYLRDPSSEVWRILPWDLDLTWAESMFGEGNEPFRDRVLSNPAFQVGYQNELRSQRDLLFNAEQLNPMIDEAAAIISTASNGLPMVDADRMLWDYNPILSSWYVDHNRARTGKFYDSSPNGAFSGMVLLMKQYVQRRIAFIDTALLTDRGFPNTPSIAYAGPGGYPADQLTVRASAFSAGQGGAAFAGMQWRAAELILPGMPGYDPGARATYEAQATWTSPVLTRYEATAKVPNGACRPGITCRVRVRMLDSNGRWSHWSAPVQFVAGAPKAGPPTGLKLTEIMYHSAPSDWLPSAQMDFLELYNAGAAAIDLSQLHFTQGIDYTFPTGAQLQPGAYLVLAADAHYFQARYGFAPFGEYHRELSNKGDRLLLVDAYGATALDMTYSDQTPWPEEADGKGKSLVLAVDGDLNTPQSWRASTREGGSPGMSDPLPVVINEVLPDPSTGRIVRVELYNPAGQSADVSGWVLSTARTSLPANLADAPAGLRLPAGSVIPPGGYLVVNTADADPPLLATAGALALFSAGANGRLSGWLDGSRLTIPPDGTSLGRVVTSDGAAQLVPMQAATPGGPNSGALVTPLVISRIVFDAVSGGQWVELTNIGGEALPLFDPDNLQHTWTVGGTALQLPAGITLPPGGRLVLTSLEPAQSCLAGGIVPGIRVVGPMPLHLSAQELDLALMRPTLWQAGWAFAAVDGLHYRAAAPWPALGDGIALRRLNLGALGQEPANWVAEPASPPAAGPASPGELCSFDAFINSSGRMEISWVMTPPTGAVAFRLLRSTVDDPANKIVIQTQNLAGGTSVDAPALNQLVDANISPQQDYIYWLEAVGSDNSVREIGFTTPRVRNNVAFAPVIRR